MKEKNFSAGGYRWGIIGEPLISFKDWNKEHHVKVLPEYIANDIKKMLAKGFKQEKIADEIGCNRRVVSKINNGERFNDGGVYPIYDRRKKMTNRPNLII